MRAVAVIAALVCLAALADAGSGFTRTHKEFEEEARADADVMIAAQQERREAAARAQASAPPPVKQRGSEQRGSKEDYIKAVCSAWKSLGVDITSRKECDNFRQTL
jgi:hypothetical protein